MSHDVFGVQQRIVRALAGYANPGGNVAWWAVGSAHSPGSGPLVVIECATTQSLSQLTRRAAEHLSNGAALVWWIPADERAVLACRAARPPKVYDETEEQTGNGVLPGFSCRVSELFALPGQPPAPPSESSVPIGKEPT
jgi:hypothetical protein